MNRNQAQLLIDAYLDEELDAAQEKLLADWLLADRKNLHEFVRQTHADQVVRGTLRADSQLRQSSGTLDVLARIADPAAYKEARKQYARKKQLPPRLIKVAWSITAAACLLLSMGVAMIAVSQRIHDRQAGEVLVSQAEGRNPEPQLKFVSSQPEQNALVAPTRPAPVAAAGNSSPATVPAPLAIARLTAAIPGMSVERDGKTLEIKAGMPLYEEDMLITRAFQLFDPEAVATKKPVPGAAVQYYGESTTLVLGGGTRLRLFRENGAKRVEVWEGQIRCEVAPQRPGMPLTILTPQARVEVLGTRFNVDSNPELTRVELSRGRVRVADRQTGGKFSEPVAGQFAIIDPAGDILIGRLDKYEAEDARLTGAVAARNHFGFSGTGFVDFLNPTGDQIEWITQVDAPGRYKIKIRYSLDMNAAAAARPLRLDVNDRTLNGSLTFSGTGSWENWSTLEALAPLEAGLNTLRLMATGGSGANIDYLTIEGPLSAP